MSELYSSLISTLSNYLYTYILIVLLVAAGVWFTVRTKFVQFRYLVYERRHPCHVRRAVRARQYITSNLYRYSCKLICHFSC